jgi:hypothetical protein
VVHPHAEGIEESEGKIMAKNTAVANGQGDEKALAVVGERPYAVLDMDRYALHEILETNLGASGVNVFDLDRVKVPGAGGTTWEVPGLEGPEEMKALEGIIIHWTEPRVFWKDPFSGGSKQPDCYSPDSKYGIGDPGVECKTCQFAQYGSAIRADGSPGRGQACKQLRTLFVLRPDSVLPLLVNCPPTSLKPIRDYMRRLAERRLQTFSVVTSLRLERVQSGDGIAYSRIVPTLGARLDEDQLERIREYRDGIIPALDTVSTNVAVAGEATGVSADGVPVD